MKGYKQMIKLGVNSVLFKTVDFPTAAVQIARCGYDGIEISAIEGMCEHLDVYHWREQKETLLSAVKDNGLSFLSTEMATHNRDRLLHGFEACAELGIPVVNIGPGGAMNDEESFKQISEEIQQISEDAEKFGITLCVKAHVGGAVWNTPTTLRLMETVTSPAFGVDMDPSHIHRSGENPVEAIREVLPKMKHIHIRDCTGAGPAPGTPLLQICGTGEIDLFGYFREMINAGYDGPVSLEVIGSIEDITEATLIAAESYGYMNAILRSLGARK